MNLRRHLFVLAVGITSFNLSCRNSDEYNNELHYLSSFQISVNEIKANTVKITITHNGTNRDTYHGILVTGEVHDIDNMISISKQTDTIQVYTYNQRKRVVNISGLKSANQYTYIVWGEDSLGKIVGTPSHATFTTEKSNIVVSVNPKWNISYKGHYLYEKDDFSAISVSVDGNPEERYFMEVFMVDEISSLKSELDLFYYAISNFEKKNGTNYEKDFWVEYDHYLRTSSTNFYRQLGEGDYVAYVIGVQSDGTPTGHYAKTSFHVDNHPIIDNYGYLLGKWVLEDADGNFDSLSIKKNDMFNSVYVNSWGNRQFVANIDMETAMLSINSQVIQKNVKIKTSEGTFWGDMSLCGWYIDEVTQQEHYSKVKSLAIGTLTEDSCYILTPSFTALSSDSTKASTLALRYIVETSNGTRWSVKDSKRTFPMKMTKIQIK